MIEKNNYSLELNEKCIKIIGDHVASHVLLDQYKINGKLESLIQDYQRLFVYGILEVKGLFNEEEVIFMKAMTNATMRVGSLHPKNYLIIQIKESCEFEALDVFYKVDSDQLLEKINRLGMLECYSIVMLLFMFWEQNSVSPVNKEKDITDILVQGKDQDNNLTKEIIELIEIR